MSNNSTPALRFEGFDVDWKQFKLSELYDYACSGGTPSSTNSEYYNGTIPFLGISDITERVVKKTQKSITEAGLNNCAAVLIPSGAISLAMYASVGKVAITGVPMATSQAFFNMVFSSETMRDFVFANLERADLFTEWEALISTGTQRNLNAEKVKNWAIMVPPEKEQHLISNFFARLDALITAHQYQYDRLLQTKKAMLLKMFPRPGKTIPEIRFSGFTKEWAERKLGEMVQFSKGSGYSKSDLKGSGTPIILYGRLYTKYETVIASVDTFADERPGSVFSRGGEVIVPASGETAEDISVASVVERAGVLLGGDLNVITPPRNMDSAFLAISISNGKPHADMAKMAQGKSVVHLHNADLAKIDLVYPDYDEQVQISAFFRRLDDTIALHKNRLTVLGSLKKAMLQKMFPVVGRK